MYFTTFVFFHFPLFFGFIASHSHIHPTKPPFISFLSSFFYCHFFLMQKCVQILKSSRQISMTVRSPPTLNTSAPLHGFGPPSREPPLPFRQTCSWMDRQGRPASPPMEYGGRRHERRDRYVIINHSLIYSHMTRFSFSN